MVHSMESIEELNSHGKLDGLFEGMWIRQEYSIILGYLVEHSFLPSKGY